MNMRTASRIKPLSNPDIEAYTGRCIAGGVLEAIFYLRGQHDLS